MTRKTQYLRFTSRMILMAIKAGLAVALLAMVVTSRSAQAQTFTVLYTFENTPDGAYPVAPLVRDAEGTLYGTTFFGGTDTYGTVFKWTKTTMKPSCLAFRARSAGQAGHFHPEI